MTLTMEETLALAEKLATALEIADQALKLISEDASRDQKDRLPLIREVAERARGRNATTMEQLAAIRDVYGVIK